MNAIEIEGLTKSFKGFTLGSLSLALPEGCIMGLVGENGAGKSTLMKLILDTVHKGGGYIKIFGKENTDGINRIKQDIGVVLDDPGIPESLTAKLVGNVMRHTFMNWDGGEYLRLLEKLSIPEDKPFKDFSRGMKMKLSIAAALSHKAKLLLLDEPTSGLDPVVRDEVVELLMDFTRDEGHSVLISSHIVTDLEKLCDYIAFLHKGKLLLCEEKDRLLEEYGLVNCSEEELRQIPLRAVKHAKSTPYGAQALVLRSELPEGTAVSPVSLEELFVFTVKEEEK